MSSKWYPEIDENKCVQCYRCIKMCGQHVFSLVEGQVKVKNKEKCLFGCWGCASVCKALAISLPANKSKRQWCGACGRTPCRFGFRGLKGYKIDNFPMCQGIAKTRLWEKTFTGKAAN